MFSVTAEIYDVIYAFKDYAGEALKIRQVITRERPGAKTILDIACGTGEHARLLAPAFEVDGIDVEPKFVEMARTKNPAGAFSVADMRAFHYLIADEKAVRQVEEVHRLALVPADQMVSHFTTAGLRCVFDSLGLFDRGLFIAHPLDP